MSCIARASTLLALASALLAGPAGAATVSVGVSSSGSFCQQGFNDGVVADNVCSTNGSLTADDWGASWATGGGGSSSESGTKAKVSTSMPRSA